ncbi:MAG: hypothetical protein EA398_16000 [Deltaproteobacteria bacterium]|nr:MAG: hypothetical protein EA398_16000 [Deltaproteobacteria bacterium]
MNRTVVSASSRITAPIMPRSARAIALPAVLALLLVALVGGDALALESRSFRIRGLGTGLSWMVEDAQTDLFLNPATLGRHDGISIYTNLSGLHSGGHTRPLNAADERRLDLLSPLLLGATVSPPGGNLSFGLFLEFQNSQLSLEVEDNANVDRRDFALERNRDLNILDAELNHLVLIAPLSLAVSDTARLGLTLSWQSFSGAVGYGTRSPTERYAAFDGAEVRRTTERTETDTFEFSGSRGFGALLGLDVDLGERRNFQLTAGYEPARMNIGLADLDAAAGGLGLGFSFANALQTIDFGGIHFYAPALQLNARYQLPVTDDVLVVLGTGVRAMRLNNTFRQESLERTVTSRERPENQSATVTTREVQEAELSLGVVDVPLRITTIWERPWGLFAVGINLNTYFTSTDLLNQPEFHETTYRYRNVDHGHPVRVRDTTWFNDYDRTEGNLVLGVLTIPAAVEFRPVTPVTFRLGAETRLTAFGGGDVDSTSFEGPTYREIAMDDGTVAVVQPERRSDETDGSLGIDRIATSWTMYSAGVGFDIGEGLTLDVLSFARLTDLSNWKLSVGFRYDF